MKFIYGLIGLIILGIILWNVSPFLFILLIILVIVLIIVAINQTNNNTEKSRPNQSTPNGINPFPINIGERHYSKVAGVTYNGIQNVLPLLHKGMSLNFVREPDNQYDKNAIGVWCDNQQIGYFPKYLAAEIAPLMDDGATIEGKIDKITGGRGKTYGCEIEYIIHK